jgi:ABC-2 type transport system ATP-binding protein
VRVELHDIGKTYDGHAWAIRGIDLVIPAGGIVGLIGPNGAGKTTTLRILAGVLGQNQGRVTVDGEDLAGREIDYRRRVGFLGDGHPLYRDMTPREYLRFFGQCHDLPESGIAQAIDEVLATFDLTSKADAPCGALSKGMRQRVAIARTLLHRPDLVILDEPADGLDPRGRIDLRNILLGVRERGTTLVVSSHILRELDDLCDHVAILQRGRIEVAGAVRELVERRDEDRGLVKIRVLGAPPSADPTEPSVSEDAAAATFAQRGDLVVSARREDETAVFVLRVRGGTAAIPSLLRDLLDAGVPVVGCERERSRLEDVYAQVAADAVN